MLDNVLFRLQNSKETMTPLSLRIEVSSKEQLEKIAFDLGVNTNFLIRSIFKSFIDEYENKKDLK